MTAFAIAFGREQSIVAGDTLAYTPDREDAAPLGFVNKLIVFPHLKAVAFGRGMYLPLYRAAVGLMLNPQAYTLESAADALPTLLRDETDRYAAEHGIVDATSLAMLEVGFLGWSDSENRCRVWSFQNIECYEPRDDGGAYYGLLSFPRLPPEYMQHDIRQDIDDRLIATVKACDRWFSDNRAIMGGARCGGEINAVTVNRDGLQTRTIYRFPDYDTARHAGAAVVNRIIRGDLQPSVADGLVPATEIVDTATGKPIKLAAASAQSGMNRKQRRAMKGRAA